MTQRDPHSFARPDEARVSHLSLDLMVDFAEKRLRGSATLDLVLAPGAREVVLDTRKLDIASVTNAEGDALPFTLAPKDELLGSALVVELPPGTSQVTIRYATSPDAPALDWLAPEQTAGGEHPFLFTQGHAIQTRSYIPLQDSPGIRQTYEARITVPEPLVAVMSAADRGAFAAAAQGQRIHAFEMRQPIPSYLIALAVGAIGFRATGPRTGVYAEHTLLDDAARELDEVEKMIDAAEALGGPYRWDRFDVLVMPPSFPYGGMENPRLTFASATILAGDRSLTTVIAHELAHAWAGNLVTNATWNDFWLNEGVTVYLELRMNEVLWGADRAALLRVFGSRELSAEIERLGATSPDTRLRYDMTGRDPVVGVTAIPYLKGAAFLWALEDRVGRARFDVWLRGWFDRHAFSSVTTDALLADLQEHLFDGAALPSDTQRWIDEPGLMAEATPSPSRLLEKVDASAAALSAGGSVDSLEAAHWSPQEWRHFLGTLYRGEVSHTVLAELDRTFSLSSSKNAEVLFAWLRLGARMHWDPALPVIERFLAQHGRGKFLRPLYTELVASDWGATVARRAYAGARMRYHAIVRNALDKVVHPA